MKYKKTLIISSVVLSILVIAGAGYFAYDKFYLDYRNQRDIQISYNTYQELVGVIFNELLECEPLPITYDNKTLSLIAIECLQQNGR